MMKRQHDETTKQREDETTKQRSDETMKQRNNKTTKRRNNLRALLMEGVVLRDDRSESSKFPELNAGLFPTIIITNAGGSPAA
jgi:hypothetical protein